jgi:sulfonate transport system permease protein
MAVTSIPRPGARSEPVGVALPGAAPAGGPLDLEAPRYRGARPKPRALSLALRVVVPAAALTVWWVGSSTGRISEQVLAGPPKVWTAFTELQQTGQLTDFALASGHRVLVGVAFGVTVGLVLGVLSGLYTLGEELIDSTMQINRAVPFLALVPLFIAWFGIDEQFKIVLIAVATASPMYAYTYLGVRNVDRKVVEAARGFGLRGWRLVTSVILPSALPGILMALRICLSISITGLIAAEQVGTREGVGYLVTLAKEYNRTDYMVLCIVMYAALGLAFDLFVRLLERVAMPWRRHSAVR